MSHQDEIYWSGFSKLRNENNIIEAAKCKSCQQIIIHFSAQQLIIHKNICKDRTAISSAEYDMDHTSVFDSNNIGLQNERSDYDENEMKEILEEELAKFFFSGSVPFKQVENKFFLRFIKRLCEFKIDYKLPCRQYLASTVLQRVLKKVQDKKKEILKNTDSVLLVDGWKNKSSNKKYLVFTIRNVNTTQTFLTFIDISAEHEDSISLSININQAILYAKEFYETNVFAIVTDNDIKIVKAGELARNTENEKLIRSTCASHSGNLLLKAFVENNFEREVKEIITVFRETQLETLFRDMGGTKLKNYPDTRFCYFREACNSLKNNLEYLRVLCEDDGLAIDDEIRRRVQNIEFECKLDESLTYLDPICALINVCQNPNSNVADSTELWLSLEMPTNIFDDVIEARLKKCLWNVGLAANLMHHKYKGRRLNTSNREKAERFLNEYLIDEAKTEWYTYELSTDFNFYADHCTSPISFWQLVGFKLPNLSKYITKLMLIPASTAQIESLFSSWAYIHNLTRNRLGDTKSSHLIDTLYT